MVSLTSHYFYIISQHIYLNYFQIHLFNCHFQSGSNNFKCYAKKWLSWFLLYLNTDFNHFSKKCTRLDTIYISISIYVLYIFSTPLIVTVVVTTIDMAKAMDVPCPVVGTLQRYVGVGCGIPCSALFKVRVSEWCTWLFTFTVLYSLPHCL